jgi:phosphoribosyl 1,2-cyclic phosphodiesterase/CRP-like cAMP-binding protein
VHIRFWGTRGSIPTPDRRTNHFGGNTSCVEVCGVDGFAIILDCGTGARPLGLDLLNRSAHLPPMHMLFTHTHWDHIQGFPFFLPAYVPGARLTLYGTRGLERTLEASLSDQMQHTYFPVQLSQLRARIDFVELAEQRFALGPLRVRTQFLNHTAATIGYRFELGGLAFAYCTDHEPFWWPAPGAAARPGLHPGEERHIGFVEGVDVLIHDAQYSDREYPAKRGWGHSPIEYVVDVAARARVKRLVLFHHDPLHSDQWVRRHAEAARRRARALGSAMEVLAASEGLALGLDEPRASARPPGAERRVSTAEPGGRTGSAAAGRILVAGSPAGAVKEVRESLEGTGYAIAVARNGNGDLAGLIARRRPDLLILVGGQSVAALETVQRARRQRWGASLPILVLAGSEGPGASGHLADDLTDVLSHPLNPAFLRPRVRAWLGRAGAPPPRRRERLAPRMLNADAAPGRGFLTDLPTAERAAFLAGAQTARFRSGEIIFREGEPAGGLYIVRSGRVQLTVYRDGREMTLGTASPGSAVGELAALDGGPRTATARAVGTTTADYVPRAVFSAGLAVAPAAATRLIRLMAERLRQTDPLVGELAGARSGPPVRPSRRRGRVRRA